MITWKSFPECPYRFQDGQERSLRAAQWTCSASGQQLCWKVRGWCLPAPIPPTRAITSKQRCGWQQARADPNTTLSCPTPGIDRDWSSQGKRIRSHTQKPACKKFLLEVRKIQCDNESHSHMNVGTGHPERLQNLPGFGEMQNWNGLRPEQIWLLPPEWSSEWAPESGLEKMFSHVF